VRYTIECVGSPQELVKGVRRMQSLNSKADDPTQKISSSNLPITSRAQDTTDPPAISVLCKNCLAAYSALCDGPAVSTSELLSALASIEMHLIMSLKILTDLNKSLHEGEFLDLKLMSLANFLVALLIASRTEPNERWQVWRHQ
jgi:hypothetical protein